MAPVRQRRAPPAPPAHHDLADELIAFCQALRVPSGRAVGQPLRLLDYQLEFLRAVADDDIRLTMFIIARKGGKTAMAAAVALAAVAGPLAVKNGQVYSAALSRDQASLVFDLASKMVNLTPWLSPLVRITPAAKRIFCPATGCTYRALASEATTAHGLEPALWIYDELGQVAGAHDHLLDALTTSQATVAHPKGIIITTQAGSDADILSKMIDQQIAAPDPATKLILHTAPADADIQIESTWRAAQPALGAIIPVDYYADAARKAAASPVEEQKFRRYLLNQRIVAGPRLLFAPATWRRCRQEPDLALFADPDCAVYGGLDLSERTDLSALALVVKRGQDWHFRFRIWTPAATMRERGQRDGIPYEAWAAAGWITAVPGETIALDHVAVDILETVAQVPGLRMIGFDPYRFSLLANEFAAMGVAPPPMKPKKQNAETFVPAADVLGSAALEGRIFMGGSDMLTHSASHLAIDDRTRKLRKLDTEGRIDPLIAALMAVATLTEDDRVPDISAWIG